MEKYRRKPDFILDAITFEEFVEHGKKVAVSLVGGVPWSFKYEGHAVTHVTDTQYLINKIDETVSFHKGDILVTTKDGALLALNPHYFENNYEPVADPKLFEFNEDIRWILGRPNFTCAHTANSLRALGQDIPNKAEEEQAAAIYWMLSMYEKHGNDWRKKGAEEMRANLQKVQETAGSAEAG